MLARILERNLYDTPLGVLTMASAAGDDVLTWASLAVVAAIVASNGAWALPYILVLSILFGLLLIFVVRPALARYRDRPLGQGELARTVAACGGKLLGAGLGARAQELAVRESVAVGALMNTRGLTELVVPNIGRDLGVVDGPLFTLLVVMAGADHGGHLPASGRGAA